MGMWRVVIGVVAAMVLSERVTTTVQLSPAPPSILIDVAQAGGAWWFPQTPPFDPLLHHQGKALVEFLRTTGFAVAIHDEGAITAEGLGPYDLVITLSGGTRTPDEGAIWRNYVDGGGKLVLLSDIGSSRELPRSFGLEVSTQVVDGEVAVLPTHPITNGLTSLRVFGGHSYSAVPQAATILGWVGDEPVMGVVRVGAGDVFFMSDINGFQILPNVNHWPRPFLDNLLDFMVGQRPPLVVPLAHYVIEGGTRNRIPFFSVDLFHLPDVACWEQVYDARDFTFIGPREITELAFRLDGAQTPVSLKLSDVEIQLATTSRPPDGLDFLTFCTDTNAESALTVVRRNTLELGSKGQVNPLGQALTAFPWLNAKAFDLVVPIQPFGYDPADGNLLVRVMTSDGVVERFDGDDQINTFMDAVFDPGDGVSSVWTLAPFINTSFRESRGLVTQFTFAETRFNRPPTAAAGLDRPAVACTSAAGTQVLLDGSGSTDPDFDVLSYTWTGSFPEGGGRVAGPTATVTLPLGGPHTVLLTVEDPDGASDVDSVAITIVDTVSPLLFLAAAAVDVSPTAPEGTALDVLALSGASAVDACDPAPQLTHDAPPVFPIGSRTEVTITAADASANRVSRIFLVTVKSVAEAAADLAAAVRALGLPRAIARSLSAPLTAVQQVLADDRPGNDVAAVGVLVGFVNTVQARRGTSLDAATADLLIAAADRLIAALGG